MIIHIRPDRAVSPREAVVIKAGGVVNPATTMRYFIIVRRKYQEAASKYDGDKGTKGKLNDHACWMRTCCGTSEYVLNSPINNQRADTCSESDPSHCPGVRFMSRK